MDLDFWWLLVIPLIFGLGWMAARFDLKHLLAEGTNLPRSYFRGLNFLLSEQHDKAIDAFIEVAKLDPETTELHFALGNLFRRRGETERAIRVHQNLLNRTDLPVVERDHALYELGQDFLKAGLFDRAETAFEQLAAGIYASEAQRSLLTIYSIQKDWQRAIAIAERLEVLGVQSCRQQIAQFYCELAEEALQRKQLEQARSELERSLVAHPTNARAMILQGQVELALGNLTAAIDAWMQIEKENATYLPLVAEKLMSAHEKLGLAEQGSRLLIDYLERHASHDLLDIAYPYIAAHQGVEAAHALARAQMQKAPNLTGMLRLLEAQLASAETERRSELELMRRLLIQRTKNLPRYICRDCGFRARFFYWQCPGCRGWETYASCRTEPMAHS
ncbi:lipopolysaccharide assembly protein LapB [Mycoavidus sp. SF9855]|uniref:lipopolysaccharide assembly protein LapB n=1 Tax=Mycoavidus sp. SF9855 TaxID=2968475 RepID=UPI00211C03CD|nr:lipopolysaccharide assembly protein LapB [Mycoavidus sp. SF9855]UUM21116.1 lipopolysaccharide assembly protein LapB [Mycoavidus sp. SF9855]